MTSSLSSTEESTSVAHRTDARGGSSTGDQQLRKQKILFHRKRKRNQECPTKTTLSGKMEKSTIASSRCESNPRTFLGYSPTFFVSVVMFMILCGASIVIALTISNLQEEDKIEEATQLAMDTGKCFSNQLDQAILPLFSIAQFALNLEIFRDLPNEIEASPFDTTRTDDRVYRNVTGVCDDLELVTRFVSIASAIKTNSKMDDILVNIQLAPAGVICLLHPMNNTEDFENGKYLDSTGAWGLDLLNDPIMKYIALGSIDQEDVVVAGPMPLVQCPDCGDFFIARLPIIDPKHEIVGLDGVSYPRWGFATALIDWSQMVNTSGILHSFREGHGGRSPSSDDFEFRLTRTDRTYNKTANFYNENIVVLAESKNFEAVFSCDRHGSGLVSVPLETTNSEWEMHVVFSKKDINRWTYVVIVFCIVFSSLISWLIYTVLIQKQHRTMMEAMTWAQEAKVETERNVTAYFAHEIRNPLSAMDSALQTINEQEIPMKSRELIQSMKLCASLMSGIMNNLLDARKLQEGMVEFRICPISLDQLVHGMHRMMQPLIKPNVEFRLENRVPSQKDYVMGDLQRIQQVLTNTITNAAKYTLSGSITLRCSISKDSIVCFEIDDTGPGIPKSKQEQLFERFVQRGGAPGTGLGLAISKEMVTMMGGTICFESDPTIRPGTTCIVRLPLEPCESVEDYPNPPSQVGLDDPIMKPINILIMDDVKINRTMLERRLKKAVTPNADIFMATNGEEALKMVESHRFDIIICDQYMEEAGGVMVGTDVIIAMRRDRVEALIVGCSGNDLDDEFLEAGADLVWGKPMPSNEEIINQLRQGLADRDLV